MKKTIMAGIISMLASLPVHAQESIYSDNVVVTANRVAQSRDNVLADVSVIEREEIERAGQSTLVELLRTQPGVEIDSYGGPGALANVRLRGTNSQSVVVLVDGMRVGSATSGTTAFNQIPPEQIERIEIVRGPASSLYGADAVGGVIQIFTRKGDGKMQVGGYAGYGSYNTRQAGASVSGGIDNTRFAFNVGSTNTDGISSFRTNQGYDADDDSFRNLTFSGQLSHTLAEGHEIALQLYNSDGHSNIDGNNFPAHMDMRQYSYAVTSSNRFAANWLSRLKLGESMDENDSVGFGYNSSVKTYQRQYSWQNDLTLPLGMLTLAYDRLEQHVESDTAYSKTYRSDNGWLANYLLEQGPHAFRAGLRSDDDSQFGRHNTGNIGYGYRFDQFWRVTGNYGTAFRAPTFNDLYWPYQDFGFGYSFQGNPNLKPETSRNKEISLVYDQGHHRVSATAFHNKVDDLIIGFQGIPADTPTNIGSATIQGLTLAYEGWFGNFHLRANADLQNPKDDETGKLLPRRARRYASLVASKTWGELEVGTEMSASGQRYNDTENSIKLGGYALVNLIANYTLNKDWSLNARLNNLFDREYALATTASSFAPDAPAYDTPGANLFVGVRWQPK
jgi:vitamin B12 transporter